MRERVAWLVNPYGPLPGEGWREYRFATLGRMLAESGYTVTWWTAAFSHHFKVHRAREWKDVPIGRGFSARLVPTPGYRRHVGAGRLWFEVVFAWRLWRAGHGERNGPDVVITPDTPQPAALAAAHLAQRFNARLIVDVMDLWPELFLLAVPKILRPAARPLLWPFAAVRALVRRRAQAITALCPSYLSHALRDAALCIGSRVIYNGIDIGSFRAAMSAQLDSRKVLGRSKRARELWAIFAGTLGRNYDIECLGAAAAMLQDDLPSIHIWVAGDGPLRARLNELAARGVSNLHCLGVLDHRMLAAVYRHFDVGLCAYSADSNVGMPDKAYDYMAAGLPIISSLQGDLKSMIQCKRIGLDYEAGNAASLATALRRLAGDTLLREELARNAAEAGREFDHAIQYGQLHALLGRLNCGEGVGVGRRMTQMPDATLSPTHMQKLCRRDCSEDSGRQQN